MMHARRLGVLLVFLAACGGGGGHGGPPDGAPPAIDAMPDAAPPAPARLTVLVGGQPATSWTFPATSTGARAEITMFVRNDGAAAASLAPAIADAAYAIDAAASTCDDVASLAPGAYCHLRVKFTPGAAGAHDASLALAGASAVPLHGVAFAPPAGLAVDRYAIDFGVITTGQAAPDASLLISNRGTTDLALGARTVAGAGFTLVTDNCPAPLTPGAACTATLRFQPTKPGPATGTLTLTAGATQLAIPLSGYGARVFDVQKTGKGAGAVTSTPDVSCGAACLDNALGTVVLTATADGGSVFAGWSSFCGTQPTCTIAPGPSVYLDADFEPAGSKAIAITFAGDGTGRADVYTGAALDFLTTCTSSCTTYVASGTEVHVFGFTPSTFGGWTGACVTSAADCNLGTVVSDRAATATFMRDEREVITLVPPAPPLAIAYAPDGDLIVADADAVRKLTPTGAVVWTASGVGGASAIATDGAGHVFGLSGATLFALSPAGALAWTTAVPASPTGPQQAWGASLAASPDGSVIAVLQPDGAFVVDGTGAKRFQAKGVFNAHAVAVDAGGIVAVANDDGSGDNSEAHRYDETGAALTTLPAQSEIGYYDIAIAYDASGELCAHSTGHSSAMISRTDAAGAFAFLKSEQTSAAADLPTGLAVASTGDLIAARGYDDETASGLVLEQWSPTGTLLWSHVKKPMIYAVPDVPDGVTPAAIAADGAKHVAVAGTYGYSYPWIQIYALP